MTKPRASASWFVLCLGFILIAGLLFAPSRSVAADTTSPIVGTWEGTLDPGAQPKKRIVVHIAIGQDGVLSGTIDYPDQDTSGILITAITYKQSVLHLESTPTLVTYDGAMSKDSSEITGVWIQGGAKLNLNLKRTA
jgi:hypothetical protein